MLMYSYGLYIKAKEGTEYSALQFLVEASGLEL